MVTTNKINKSIWFNILEYSVNVSNIIARKFHEFLDIISAYGNDDLFIWETLCGHIDVWFRFISVIDHLFDTFDLLVWQFQKVFFEFENIFDIPHQCLSIWMTRIHDWQFLCRFVDFSVTNFIQLVSPQPVDQFSQTKLRWKVPNESYPHICGMYKSNNKWLRYQAISSCKSFVC